MLALELDEVWRHRDLIVMLAVRDISARFKQTLLGMGWAVLQPLFSTFLFTLIFAVMARVPSPPGVPYHLLVLSGLVPWQFVSQAVTHGTNVLIGHAALVSKVYFPRLVLPLAAVLPPLVDLGIGLLLYLVAQAVTGPAPTWRLLTLPLLAMAATLVALAPALWLSVLNVRYRDVGHALPFLLQLGLYAAPIVYPLDLVPSRWRWLYELNPMVTLVGGFRWALLGMPAPSVWNVLSGSVLVLLLMLGGMLVFHRAQDTMADRI